MAEIKQMIIASVAKEVTQRTKVNVSMNDGRNGRKGHNISTAYNNISLPVSHGTRVTSQTIL